MDASSLVDRVIPVRRAAARRNTNYAETHTDESENDSPQENKKKKKGSTTVKYSGSGGSASLKFKISSTRPLHASFSEASTSISAPISTATPRPRPRPIFNKKKVPEPKAEPKPPSSAIIDSDGSGSDLTPLTSPADSPEQNTKPPSPPKPHTPQASGLQKRRTAPSPSTSTLPWRPTRDEAWSRKSLGTYVWVLLDSRARVFDPEETTGRSRERLWWPGKIEYGPKSSPMNVRLFGNASLGVKNVEIQQPCELNIQSLNDPSHRPRFGCPTFVTPSDFDSDDLNGSPRKKQKRDRGDLEERWSVAVAEMVQKKAEEEDGSDDLPEVGTLEFKYILPSPTKSAKGTSKGNQRGKAPRKGESVSEEEPDMDPGLEAIYVDRWSPPDADDTLTIPGELILAREGRRQTTYWPARILQYIPPKKWKQEPKYLVEYLDDTKLAIPRDIFYTTDEDQFATCLLGTWDSEFQEVLNDDEDEVSPQQDNRERSTSPLPCNPPPPGAEFTQLGIRQQFVYTKPVLQGILNEGYAPARKRHDKFIVGGQARQSVVDEAGLRGKMDPKHVAELQEHLIVWCLRGERRGDFIADEEDEARGDVSVANGVDSEPDHTVQDLLRLGHLDTPPQALPRPLSPSQPVVDLSATSSPRDVPPPSSFSLMEEIEAPPLSLPSVSSSIVESPRATSIGSGVDMDLTLEDVDDHPRSPQKPMVHTESPRQRGCDAFEALSRKEKSDYCLNVLLPEAILQILLWRAGLRTSIELLSEAEEKELHDQGDALIKERDWVYDVTRLRSSKLRQLRRTQSSQGSFSLGPLSVTGRPRRNVGVPKSYQE